MSSFAAGIVMVRNRRKKKSALFSRKNMVQYIRASVPHMSSIGQACLLN